MKTIGALALALLLAACGPAASAPSPSSASPSSPPTALATATPTATPSPSPSAAATPTGTPISLPTSATISAPTGDVVWAFVGGTRLFRSSDRGITWQERGIPAGPIGDIAFINDREGWLSSPGSPATQCQTQAVSIWHTVDGASTWDRLYQADSSDTMCKGGLWFADVQRGFLTLTSPNSTVAIQRTIDGGRTWTRSQPLPDAPGFTSATAGSTLAAGRVKAVGTTLFVSAIASGSGSSKAHAYRSTDGGATWVYASTASQQNVEIAFVSTTRWVQIGPPGQSSETTDAGATWHAFTTDYQQAAPVNPQIVFGDANVGYATVRGQIQRTVDGGAHWTALKTPGT